MRLQMKIQLPILLLIVLMCGVSGYMSYQKASDSLRVALVGNMRGEAEGLVRVMRDMTQRIVSETANLAQRKEVLDFFSGNINDKAVGEAFTPVLKRFQADYTDFDRVALIDSKGLIVASTAPSSIGQNFGDRLYFQEAIKGQSCLSQPLKSRVSGKGAIIAASPVKQGEKIIGVLYVSMPLEHFYEMAVKPIVVGKHGYAFMLDQTGLIVVHNNPEWIFNSSLPSMSHYREMASSKTPGIKDFIGNTGSHVFNYYMKDSFSGLSAVIQAEYDDVFSGLTELRNNAVIVAIASFLVAALLIILVMRPVLGTINQIVAFAHGVSKGDFSLEPTSHGQDELGSLVSSIKEISAVLNRLIDSTMRISETISIGHYRDRIDANEFSGAYKKLCGAVNQVADAYTNTLDAIPMPLMAADQDYRMTYLNTATQSILGGNFVGQSCGEKLKSPLCDTDKCIARCAREKRGIQIVETSVQPNDKQQMEFSIIALPLFDAQGTVQGHLEMCSDLTKIKEQQQLILDVAQQALGISNRVADASEKIALQVEEVNQGTSIQRDRVSATAAAMDEMNTTVMEVARNAGDARAQSESTRDQATRGADLVNKVIAAIHQVNNVAMELQHNMQDLGAQAESIGGVMNVISDIADQTNLLALNAAIEAARAGEAGRGFAVVADEVRKLAEKTMSATNEVGSSINGIQASTANNIQRVGAATASVSEATELAGTSGNALKEIVTLAGENSALISSIAAAAEQQSATSVEINRAIEEINGIADDTAEGMTRSAHAVQELSHMAQELKNVLDRLTK